MGTRLPALERGQPLPQTDGPPKAVLSCRGLPLSAHLPAVPRMPGLPPYSRNTCLKADMFPPLVLPRFCVGSFLSLLPHRRLRGSRTEQDSGAEPAGQPIHPPSLSSSEAHGPRSGRCGPLLPFPPRPPGPGRRKLSAASENFRGRACPGTRFLTPPRVK